METLLRMLDDRAEAFRAESARLSADDRIDEGTFAKIRANVCGICKSVLQVLPMDQAERKLQALHETWAASRSEAQGHGDAQRATIETVKLETLEEILAQISGKGM